MLDLFYIVLFLMFVVPVCVGIYEMVYSWLFDDLEAEEDWYDQQ